MVMLVTIKTCTIKYHLLLIAQIRNPDGTTCHLLQQPAMRQSSVQTLNVWVEHTGLVIFVEAELILDGLKQENPFLRMEVNYFIDDWLRQY